MAPSIDTEFLGQPFSAKRRLGPVLLEAMEDAHAFWVIAAWAQVSGLTPIGDALRALRARGGVCSAILGIDSGIATREGLELALDVFDPAIVFHDTGTRSFHPKVYCVERPKEVVLAVGSSNLTEGGLFRNYEANVVLRLDRSRSADERIYEGAIDFRDRLLAEEMPSQPLTPDLIGRLAEEETLVTSRAHREERERTRRGKSESLAKSIFGEAVAGLPAAPRRPVEAPRVPVDDEAAGGVVPTASPVLLWWKQLTPSDVARKPESSNQRYEVALSRAGHDIDVETWFRRDLLGTIEWSEETMSSGNVKDVAYVPFGVFVGDEYIGQYELLVDHAEVRIQGKKKYPPTHLNWSSMIALIREQDFRDWWLELARLEDGVFRLRLLREEPDAATA